MMQAKTSSGSAPHRERLVHVIQGEYGVSADPSVVFTTILGSCVATCMWDPVSKVGGMNHFLLPGERDGGGELVRYGVNAMELLINGLLQNGAMRQRLQAKLFGGAHVIQNLSDVGAQNAEFATRFLSAEGIPCAAMSLGGDRARRVRFWPTTGRAGQMLIDSAAPEVLSAERARPAPAPPTAGSVELF
jgi:chemotaxis protein CheD